MKIPEFMENAQCAKIFPVCKSPTPQGQQCFEQAIKMDPGYDKVLVAPENLEIKSDTIKKQVFVDLRSLNNVNCGFGQISLNYGRIKGALFLDDIEFTLIVPEEYVGAFGDKAKYLSEKNINPTTFSNLAIDLLHITNQGSHFAGIPKHVPVVQTVHDLNFLYEKNVFRGWKHLIKMNFRFKRVNAIVAISNFVADDIRKHLNLNGKKLQVIYNGVERIDKNPEEKPEFVKSPERPFFFTIGQVRKKKNFHTLLNVMKAFPEYDLYIAGENQRKYAMNIQKRIVDENISNVFLTGPISNQKRVWLYRHCEAFLFPSKVEGFGLPVIEAMQFGKAVFSSPMTSLTEICGGYAFLWEDDFDSEKMIKVIQKHLPGFYDNTDYISEMKDYAYSFSYERHTNQYKDLYYDLLGMKK